jgi:GNAT superfamily N-acetyltransferase
MAEAKANGLEVVRLRERSEVYIRPIEADDKAALERGLERLSRASRYRRFFSPISRFTGAQLRYLTEVDHHDHEALIAFPVENGDATVPVGVARYVLDEQEGSEEHAAEVAVVVADDWQGRGLATALLQRLVARGRANGFESFVAYALAENDDVVEVLGRLGRLEVIDREGQIVTMRLELPGELDDASPLRRLLRAAAQGSAQDLPLAALFRTLTGGS